MTLLDVERLAEWFDAQGLAPGGRIDAEPMVGGASNAMFAVRRGDERWVLRRPAGVAVERANDGMRREYRFLEALAGTDVPHPRVVALCEDPAVLGCTFFLMEEVRGVPADTIEGERGAEAGLAMVAALAALHAVDWEAAGLADLGHPERFHERQVERWTRQLASYDGRALPGIDVVAAWLGEHCPAGFRPTIMHGDYHGRNVLVAPERPVKVLAILDWETATIGDPLLDLAGLCEVLRARAAAGWPDAPALVERYRTARGLDDLPDLTYYAVLYNFRLAVLLEGIYQRSLRDPNRPDQDAIADLVLATMARARELAA